VFELESRLEDSPLPPGVTLPPGVYTATGC